ncbi:MAG: PQQ-binding-like beta-propeller repeat protein [Dehalococcoidia bacterium]|nr:PQQ-binding-like beta-propeller repeat protein [Dehalococcoidia bacterium]
MGELVRVCARCGHVNPMDGPDRCRNCWSALSGVAPVPRAEGERSPRFASLRKRRVLLPSLLVLAVGLTVWGVLVFFDLGPNPPTATTRAAAEVVRGVWSQVGRTAENSGFSPEHIFVPRKIDWSYDTSEPLLAAPTVDEERLYLTTQTGRILALDRGSGEVVWQYDTGHHAGFPATATPAVAGELVIAPVRPGRVVGLHRRTREVVWETDIRAPLMASPIVVEGSVYVGAGDEMLYALDAATGRERWTFHVLDRITAPVAYADDAVVVVNEESLVHIVDTNTGRKRFVYDAGAGSLGRNIRGGPAIHGELAYFHTQGGTVWAVDRRTITYPFERAIAYWKTNFFLWGITSELPVQKGTAWITGLGGTLMHGPATAHDTVYAATVEGRVWALDAGSGEVRWSTQPGAGISSGVTVAGDTVVLGTEDGRLLGLNAHTGEQQWDFGLGGKISSRPVAVDGKLYLASEDGKVYAVSG